MHPSGASVAVHSSAADEVVKADKMTEAETDLNTGHRGAGDDCFGKAIQYGGRGAGAGEPLLPVEWLRRR